MDQSAYLGLCIGFVYKLCVTDDVCQGQGDRPLVKNNMYNIRARSPDSTELDLATSNVHYLPVGASHQSTRRKALIQPNGV